MTYNQEQINKEFTKQIKEIELEDENFEGNLIIENYSSLEKIYLQNIESIEQITLKDLPNLQEIAIWDCGLQELVIENCPNIKILNLRKNSLNDLNFLINLDSLQELEITGNSKLVEILKSYHGDWKIYKQILTLQKENKESKEKEEELSSKYRGLKKSIKTNVVDQLDQQLDQINQKMERSGSFSQAGNTDELTKVAGQVVKNLKGINENLKNELTESKTEIQSLEEKLSQKQKEINYLNSQLQAQSEKIFSAYQYCVTEKEEKKLLEELVKVHIEFTKFKEQESESEDYDEKIEDYEEKEKEIKNSLRKKLDKDKMNEIRKILIECEKIALQQLELETNLNEKVTLNQQILLQIPYNQENEAKTRQLELELAKAKGQLEIYQNQLANPFSQTIIANYGQLAVGNQANFTNQITNNYYQQIISEIEQEIANSLAKQEISPAEQKVINQTIIYLGTQELFLNYRQELISNLIKSYCQLTKQSKLVKLTNNLGKIMNISSKLAGKLPGGKVAETPLNILETILNLAQSTLQEEDLKKYRQQLQEIFVKDKQSLILFDESYRSLIQSIWPDNNQSKVVQNIIATLQLKQTQLKPFSDNHNICKLGEVWEAMLPDLSLEELKTLLTNLDKKLTISQREFYSQRQELAKQSWFKTIEQKTDLLQEKKAEQLENQIVHLNISE
ncbi:MAG: hypothetical protein LBR43_01825 [Spiroplasmataceae bacterium]|nr:hypothetical protein [Spiroplasmataceae bacterium]